MGGSRRASGRERAEPLVYSHAMAIAAPAVKPDGLARIFAWRRVRFVLIVSLMFGAAAQHRQPGAVVRHVRARHHHGHGDPLHVRPVRAVAAAAVATVLALGLAAARHRDRDSVRCVFAYWITTGGNPELGTNKLRQAGYAQLCITALLFAPWIAVGAMIRQREAFARDQALAFELEKSELERKALDTRLRLLQAQVEPHFLFNTLANVQALVDAGSPQASSVLKSLIAYLRAAVPRMQRNRHDARPGAGPGACVSGAHADAHARSLAVRAAHRAGGERAAMSADDAAHAGRECRAARHRSERGGRTHRRRRLAARRSLSRARDGHRRRTADRRTGGLGTGLSTLRERMQLAFGGDAQLRLTEVQPHGVCAELEFPARQESA